MTDQKEMVPYTAGGLKSLTDAQSLPGWALSPSGGVNSALRRDAVENAAKCLGLALRPANKDEVAVFLGDLFDWGRAFGLSVPDPAMAAHYYYEVLGHMPAWAIEKAIKSTITTWKWGNRMPLPSDVRDNSPQELCDMIMAQKRLNQHLATGHFIT